MLGRNWKGKKEKLGANGGYLRVKLNTMSTIIRDFSLFHLWMEYCYFLILYSLGTKILERKSCVRKKRPSANSNLSIFFSYIRPVTPSKKSSKSKNFVLTTTTTNSTWHIRTESKNVWSRYIFSQFLESLVINSFCKALWNLSWVEFEEK